MLERTLMIIKPDAVKKKLIGKIVGRFEDEGLNIVAIRRCHLSKQEAEGFYAVHRGKGVFEELTTFMSGGACGPIVLEGDNAIKRVREIMGATNYKEALPGTLRHSYASSITENVVHGSDAPETAKFEISYFFGQLELYTTT